MGEAKRKKQATTFQESNEPQYLATSYGVLRIFSSKKGLNLSTDDFIDPNFKIKEFDIEVPHTVEEWQSYFFTTNPESRLTDKHFNGLNRANLHTGAFKEYLRKKWVKNLLKSD